MKENMFSEKQKRDAMYALNIFNKTDTIRSVSYISEDGKFLEIDEHDDIADFFKSLNILEDSSLSGELMLSLGFIKASVSIKYIFLPFTKVTPEQLNAVEKVVLECQNSSYDSTFNVYALNPKTNKFKNYKIDLSDPNAVETIKSGIRRLNSRGTFSVLDRNSEFEI
jgi:hypothetical protein